MKMSFAVVVIGTLRVNKIPDAVLMGPLTLRVWNSGLPVLQCYWVLVEALTSQAGLRQKFDEKKNKTKHECM